MHALMRESPRCNQLLQCAPLHQMSSIRLHTTFAERALPWEWTDLLSHLLHRNITPIKSVGPWTGMLSPYTSSLLCRTITHTWPWDPSRCAIYEKEQVILSVGISPHLGMWELDTLLWGPLRKKSFHPTYSAAWERLGDLKSAVCPVVFMVKNYSLPLIFVPKTTSSGYSDVGPSKY